MFSFYHSMHLTLGVAASNTAALTPLPHAVQCQVLNALTASITSINAAGSLSQQHIDLLLNPLLVVGGIGVCGFLIDQTTDVGQLIQKVKQLTDVIRYGRCIGIDAFQMFLINAAYTFHTIVDTVVVTVCARLRSFTRLH